MAEAYFSATGSKGEWLAALEASRKEQALSDAAPELLSHLEFAVKLLRPFGHTAQVQAMEAAIAKARGAA